MHSGHSGGYDDDIDHLDQRAALDDLHRAAYKHVYYQQFYDAAYQLDEHHLNYHYPAPINYVHDESCDLDDDCSCHVLDDIDEHKHNLDHLDFDDPS